MLRIFGTVAENNLGVEGAKFIAQALRSCHSSLTSLGLSRTANTDASVTLTSEIRHCLMAVEAVNGLGAEGARVIAEALANHRALATLNLAGSPSWRVFFDERAKASILIRTDAILPGNGVGDEGAKNVAAHMLDDRHTTLTKLILWGEFFFYELTRLKLTDTDDCMCTKRKKVTELVRKVPMPSRRHWTPATTPHSFRSISLVQYVRFSTSDLQTDARI
jgi:hypothetical protein